MTNAFDRVNYLMERASGNIFPGAVLRVSVGKREVFHRPFGTLRPRGHGERIRHSTVFDVASLTKCMSVATLCMLGVQEGWCSLDDDVTKTLGPFESGKPIRVHELLSHRSGLPNWRPYLDWLFERHSGIEPGTEESIQFTKNCIRGELPVAETGERAIYSDLGYMALGWWLEQTCGEPLNQLFEQRVANPLKLKKTRYIPVHSWDAIGAFPCQSTMAPTEICPGRKRLTHGEVHDENAFILGGIAGHAGLFSTAEDVGVWADTLRASYKRSGFIERKVIRTFWAPIPADDDPSWRLGFDGVSPGSSSGGTHVSPTSICHLGFTGCSVWIDLERDATAVLLSNRVHPSRDNNQIRDFRPVLHDAIWKAIDEG